MSGQLIENRDLRQRDIVPPEKLAKCRVTVVGVGAIGRQVALQLAAMGVPWMQLIDPDVVEPVNLGCQGYMESDIGNSKVSATAGLCHQLNSAMTLSVVERRFCRSNETGEVLFCCVDSIETRRFIWEAVRERVDFFCDGRMSAEVLRVVTAACHFSREHYPRTLFAADQAYEGACTAKSTIYCANVAAGLMVGQFTKWLRAMPVDADLSLNLLAAELDLAECH
jgi:hypothetical protein